MIKVIKNINGIELSVCVEAFFREQAEALLEIISGINCSDYKDGYRIQIGFSIFTMYKNENGYSILAPDYSKNPLTDNTEDLSAALIIQLEQGMFLHSVGLEGEQVSYLDKIVCNKGVLDTDKIYMERTDGYKKGDSGWYIGAVEGNNQSEELEAFYAFQVIKSRPSIIKVLALPSGYLAVFNGDELEAVVNERNEEIYRL